MGSVGKISCISLLLAAVHVACASTPYTIPSHWIEGSNVFEPRVYDFQFTDVCFSSPTDGWIVGETFFLRVSGDELRLTFVGDSPSFSTVAAVSHSEAWAGGHDYRRDQAVLWHYSEDSWRPVDLGTLDLRGDISIKKLRFESPTRGWALLSHLPPRSERGSSPIIPSSSLLHFDGTAWSKVPLGAGTEALWLTDLCVDASGSGWAVGLAPGSGDRRGRGVVLRKQGLDWHEMEPPAIEGGWALYRLVCLDGGSMASSGVIVPRKGADEQKGFLLTYDGSWQRVAFPEPYEDYEPAAMAAASRSEIWIFASGLLSDDVFVRFRDGQWSTVPMPALPSVSNFPLAAIPTWVGGVSIAEMEFVSPTEAWAVGTKNHGGGEWRGLVWHYKDGAWTNRNWNWHFWRERWFGLLGR